MKFEPKRAIHLAAGLALAAASGLSLAQSSGHAPYYRNHQATPSPGNASGMRDMGTSGGSYGLREDLDGTVVSDREAAQTCGVLSDERKREDCVAAITNGDSTLRGTSQDDGMSTRDGNRRGAEDSMTMPRR